MTRYKTMFAGFAGLAVLAHGQQPQQQPDSTLQQLLAEVRMLRMTLQQSALVAPKMQATLQRMQMQREAVSGISRDLEAVRTQMARAAGEQAAMTSEAKRLQEEANRAADPGRRAESEGRVRAYQSMVEERVTANAELRAREADLAGRLRAEQGKFEELNDRLTMLERQLEAPMTGEPPTKPQ